MEKRMTSSILDEKEEEEEEEEVFACLSFRNLAVGSTDLRPSFSSTDSSTSSDGDLEFEFLPSAETISHRRISFYPMFNGERGEKIPESKVVEEQEEEEEEIYPSKTNCFWLTYKKKERRRRDGIIEKCRSTGSDSTSRPWSKLRDLVVMGRSRSDGNEKLLLPSPTRTTATRKDGREDQRRTTFLPYRSEVVSLFPARRVLPRRKSQL